MILHIIAVDLLNSVSLHVALVPQTVRWLTVGEPTGGSLLEAMGYPMVVKYRMGAWG